MSAGPAPAGGAEGESTPGLSPSSGLPPTLELRGLQMLPSHPFLHHHREHFSVCVYASYKVTNYWIQSEFILISLIISAKTLFPIKVTFMGGHKFGGH